MGFIPQDQIDKVLTATDIVELAGSYMTLKPSGKHFMGLSPFTREKTPSFCVTPDKQIFKDFSSGAGGNAFKLIMLMENVTFPEAVEILAERVGLEIQYDRSSVNNGQTESGEDRLPKRDLQSACMLAMKFYHLGYKKSEKAAFAREYVTNRHISDGAVDQFRIGYSPDSWNAFSDFATERGVPEQALKQAALADRNNSGRLYDRFRGRLMFPIFDVNDAVIGFGARQLNADDNGPKYLNSPETPIFNKSKNLYGLNVAKDAIKELGYAIVMEGYTDVIAAHQAGVNNAVATLGTAMTRDHARLLSRFCQRTIVMYDADQAGLNAADRSINLLLAEDLNVKIVTLPEGADPADMLSAGKVDEFNGYIEQSRTLIDFKVDRLRHKYDLSTVTGQTKAGQEVVSILQDINDSIRRDIILREFCSALQLNEDSLRGAMRQKSKWQQNRNGRPDQGDAAADPVPTNVKLSNMSQMLFKLLLNHPTLSQPLTALDPNEIEEAPVREAFRQLLDSLHTGTFTVQAFAAKLENQQLSTDFLWPLVDAEDVISLSEDKVRDLVHDCLRHLQRRQKDRDLNDIKSHIRQAEQSLSQGDESQRAVLNDLYRQLQSLKQEMSNV